MTKHLHIDPRAMRRPGHIEFAAIPVNQYTRSIDDEKANYSRDDPEDEDFNPNNGHGGKRKYQLNVFRN